MRPRDLGPMLQQWARLVRRHQNHEQSQKSQRPDDCENTLEVELSNTNLTYRHVMVPFVPKLV